MEPRPPVRQDQNVDDAADRLRAGDDGAAAELYERHWAVVVDVVCRRLGSVEEAEAIAQEALLRALDAARRERLRSFRAYAMRVALNLAADLQRGGHWRATRGGVDPDGLAASDPDVPDMPGGLDDERVRAAVSRLPDEQRRVVSLRYGEGASFQAIARALEMSKNGVFERHARAMAALRELIGWREP
jgi:RNA polymerase sigma-70 factor, ECF subfamily